MTDQALGQAISTAINGQVVQRYVENRTTLAEFLRGGLGLTGTKLSCELQVCGVCTVLVDGSPVSACTYLAVDIDGREVLTIEGLSSGETLHPIQQAFVENFALQCGFCTPGFVMMAKSLLDRNPNPTHDEVVHHLEGNICRCTGYAPIVEAVLDAAQRMQSGGGVTQAGNGQLGTVQPGTEQSDSPHSGAQQAGERQ